MSEPTAIEKEAGKIVEGACASLEACPRLQPRSHGQACFAEMPDEELLFDVADLFKGPSPTPPASRSCLRAHGRRPIRRRYHRRRRLHPKRRVSHQLRTLKQARLVKRPATARTSSTPCPTTTSTPCSPRA